MDERAIRGGDLEAHAAGGDSAVAAPLGAGDLHPERTAKRVGARAFASYARPAQVALERRLLDLAVELAVVLLLDPGLRGGVEEIEREGLLALEHGQESSLDLGPE